MYLPHDSRSVLDYHTVIHTFIALAHLAYSNLGARLVTDNMEPRIILWELHQSSSKDYCGTVIIVKATCKTLYKIVVMVLNPIRSYHIMNNQIYCPKYNLRFDSE